MGMAPITHKPADHRKSCPMGLPAGAADITP
jgi:hypothetical protein